MIDLREHTEPLQAFLRDGLARLARDHPATPIGHVSLYCCPWAGWVSLCVDPAPRLEQNCPDFAWAEAALYESPEWQREYEAGSPLHVITADGTALALNLETDGDEAMNAVFFAFLQHIWRDPRAQTALRSVGSTSARYGVQMLDSSYNQSWL